MLDEPTGDLDTRNSIQVMDLLLQFNLLGYPGEKKPVTMIMATHNPDIEQYADRIIYIKDGEIASGVRNETQLPMDYEDYVEFLKEQNARQ